MEKGLYKEYDATRLAGRHQSADRTEST